MGIKLKTTRVVNIEGLHDMCVNRGFCTNATIAEYNDMLDRYNPGRNEPEFKDEDVVAMAVEIWNLSDHEELGKEYLFCNDADAIKEISRAIIWNCTYPVFDFDED